MGNTYNRFYNYSLRNQLLLRMQGVHEPVATFKGWQALSRQVIKGSRAKAIMRPLFRTVADEHGQEDERLTGFKMVNCIFGLSDTEGDDLPPVEPRMWDKDQALAKLAIAEVPFDSLDGNTAGHSHGREFAINPVAKYPVKTRFHELGHIVLGHTTPDGLKEYQTHRGPMEFQAEGTSYLVMHDLDMTEHFDPGESRAYIQHWLDGERPGEELIKPVFTAADRIIRAGLVEAAMEGAS